MDDRDLDAARAFADWWHTNHPFDWWTKERGESLPHGDRLLVWDICRRAYSAGVGEIAALRARAEQAEADAEHVDVSIVIS